MTQPVTRDETAIVGWAPLPEAIAIMAGLSSYSEPVTNSPSVRVYSLRAKNVDEALHGRGASTGPLALADIDGDGNLDLFVGGRVVPGRYPEPAAQRLYQNVGGRFRVHAENTRRLDRTGMVSAAVFSDLTSSGYPDLILACDWGPVRVFRNDKGSLREVTEELGLHKF